MIDLSITQQAAIVADNFAAPKVTETVPDPRTQRDTVALSLLLCPAPAERPVVIR